MTQALVGLLDPYDTAVLVAYFILIIGVGFWSSFQNRGGSQSYFLAGRSMTWIPIGASLFASNIGSGHFVGLAGSGAASGIGMASFEMNAFFALTLLGWVFMPVYMSSGIYTMPEYLYRRFGGGRVRVCLTALSLVMYIVSKISADLYAGAIFIEESLQISLYPAIGVLLGVSALFTILGGLTAVIWTDLIQTGVMIVGAVWLAIATFVEVPVWELWRLYEKAVSNRTRYLMEQEAKNVSWAYVEYGNGVNETVDVRGRAGCGKAHAYAFHIFRPITDPDLPWPGVVFGAVICSVWYWCTDQVIVQRTLAAKNILNVKAACVLCSYLKLLPTFIILLPGMAARVLFPDTVACADRASCQAACNRPSGCADVAYAKLVLHLMPRAARGLMVAVILSALISSLTSVLSSASTIFTMDVWVRFRKRAGEVERMVVGRVFVLVLIGVSIGWVPVVRSGATVFQYIQSVSSYLVPPVCAVYVLAISWKRCTEPGAFWGLTSGLSIGLTWFLWESFYPTPACGEKSSKPAIFKIGYLHFSIFLWLITLAICAVVSLFTEPVEESKLDRLLFSTRFSIGRSPDQLQLEVAGVERKGGYDKVATDDEIDSPEVTVKPTVEAESPDGRSLPESKTKWYVRAGYWICGIETLMHDVNTQQISATQDNPEKLVAKLRMTKKWTYITNANAVLAAVVSIFLWVYFA